MENLCTVRLRTDQRAARPVTRQAARHPRPRRGWSALFVSWMFAIATAFPCAADVVAQEPSAPPGLVRCPPCDNEGRVVCPRCEGKKKLEKDCPRCDGSGERVCTQCSKYSTGDGVIPCGYCGGKGSIGTTRPKKCPECGGPGTKECPTCDGDGTLKCPKKVYDTICPRCRFAGKVSCPTCDGKKWITPEALAALRKEREKPNGSKNGGSARADKRDLDTPNVKSGHPPKPQAEDLTAPALEKRLRTLSALRDAGRSVDPSDVRRRSDQHLRATKDLATRLTETGIEDPALQNGIADVQARTRVLRTRLQEIGATVLEYEKAYLRCERRWVDRPPNVPGAQRRYRQWQEEMDTSLRLCEARANELRDNDPVALGEAVAKLDREVITLTAVADEKIAVVEAARAEAARKAAEEAARKAAEEAARKAAAGTKATGDADASPDAATVPPSAATPAPAADTAEAPRSDAEISGGSGLVWGAILGLAAVLAIGVILVVYERKTRTGRLDFED